MIAAQTPMLRCGFRPPTADNIMGGEKICVDGHEYRREVCVISPAEGSSPVSCEIVFELCSEFDQIMMEEEQIERGCGNARCKSCVTTDFHGNCLFMF